MRRRNVPLNSVTRIFEETFATDHRIVTEDLSKAILKKYGVKVPIHRLVTTETEAVKAAETLGFPLVMKIVSPQILHKTDVGGVRAGLQNEAEVRQAFRGMYPSPVKKGSMSRESCWKEWSLRGSN
jgi:3-hydroxypropionyl-CoA synthetase (ADP-forming)